MWFAGFKLSFEEIVVFAVHFKSILNAGEHGAEQAGATGPTYIKHDDTN